MCWSASSRIKRAKYMDKTEINQVNGHKFNCKTCGKRPKSKKQATSRNTADSIGNSLSQSETECKQFDDRWVYSLWGNSDIGNEFFQAIRVRAESERPNCVFHNRHVACFNDFINKCNMIEIPINGRKFTRISDDGTKFSKLDRFLVSEKFISLWEDLSVIALERRESDHCPLLLRDKVIDFGPKPFKVFDEWFFKEGRKIEFGNLDIELDKLKNDASEWEKKAEAGALNDKERETWLETRKCWLDKEIIKSNMLRQKARIRWILEGEENSKYFHATNLRKHNKCNIRGLNLDDPKILGQAETNGPDGDGGFRLTETEAMELKNPINESEIWDAITECASTKAPGPDGFNLSL
ncbi:uncharacterized protein [Rutidosis leptorrhynchoides]|uniref:uncharacterized protein n=1 Tax=Rutidosis leptorrhynchoides TaxID=125765 RepID=UPI003A9A1D5E